MASNYSSTDRKAFLDYNGLVYILGLLNQYPTNDLLEAVIEGMSDGLDEKIDLTQKGVPNGVATLDEDGKIDAEQLATASTSVYGITRLESSTNSSSESLAATPKAVKAAYDLAAGKATVTIHSAAEWARMTDYIAAEGEIVVYSDHGTIERNGVSITVPGIKIGDGLAYAVDLAFVGDDVAADILARLGRHISDTDIHITSEEREKWNNKLNCSYSASSEMLEFNNL